MNHKWHYCNVMSPTDVHLTKKSADLFAFKEKWTSDVVSLIKQSIMILKNCSDF